MWLGNVAVLLLDCLVQTRYHWIAWSELDCLQAAIVMMGAASGNKQTFTFQWNMCEWRVAPAEEMLTPFANIWRHQWFSVIHSYNLYLHFDFNSYGIRFARKLRLIIILALAFWIYWDTPVEIAEQEMTPDAMVASGSGDRVIPICRLTWSIVHAVNHSFIRSI